MSKPARIMIVVVVFGLAAAGIAYRTAHRPQTPDDSAGACLVEDLDALSKAAKVSKGSGDDSKAPQAGKASDLTCENAEGVCGPDAEVCELPKTGSEGRAAKPKVKSGSGVAESGEGQAQRNAEQQTPSQDKRLPKVIDLGRGTCIPCTKMLPILKELQTEYKGRALVEVIDLREQPDAAKVYNLRLIPTQIFFDSDGKEVWRHEGFLPKDEIEKKLKELGAS
jgi:thioredoxin 1